MQPVSDTLKVSLLLQISIGMQALKPDSALYYAKQGLDLAIRINFKKGQGDCLNRIGIVLWKSGKYDKALSFLLRSLKLREDINDESGVLKSLNNIGIIYSDQGDNAKALSYDLKAKAIAESLHDKKSLGIILSNIGNCYLKLNKIDSALIYEMQAYSLLNIIGDKGTLPNTLSILGDINYRMGHPALAMDYYRLSVNYALKNNDPAQVADTYNSIAQLYYKKGDIDSAVFYAKNALAASKAVSYPGGIFNASNLLTQIYQGKDEHLELRYLKTAMAAKDSMFNAEKIKNLQTLSFNEATRQQEIMEEKAKDANERKINLQLIGIALFILLFFLILLLLSKSRTHRKLIDFMSVFSLLLVFEFITLFIHPFVQSISNHLPVLELLILVGFASILIPLHHKSSHWLREKLAHMAHHEPVKAPKKKSPASGITK